MLGRFSMWFFTTFTQAAVTGMMVKGMWSILKKIFK